MPATTSMASAARWIDLIRPVAISIPDISFPRPVWPHRTILAESYAEALRRMSPIDSNCATQFARFLSAGTNVMQPDVAEAQRFREVGRVEASPNKINIIG